MENRIMHHIVRTVLLPLCCLAALALPVRAQEKQADLYDPAADAAAELREARVRATAEHKHVLVQVGGNWCSWCRKLDKLIAGNDTLRALVDDNYVLVRVNYSKENRNREVLAALDFPQRFGFPVLVVLDAAARRLHTQDSGLLEGGGAHDPDKVRGFLMQWTPKAVDPATYRDADR